MNLIRSGNLREKTADPGILRTGSLDVEDFGHPFPAPMALPALPLFGIPTFSLTTHSGPVCTNPQSSFFADVCEKMATR